MPSPTWQWKISKNGVSTDVERYATAVDYVTEQISTAPGNGHVVALKVSKVQVHKQQVWPYEYVCPKIPGTEE
jgi:hypothetical protein